MRTLEIEATPAEREEIPFQISPSSNLDESQELQEFRESLIGLNQNELKEKKDELIKCLGEFEGEISEEPDKEWNFLLVQLSNKIRAKVLSVTTLIDGNTNS